MRNSIAPTLWGGARVMGLRVKVRSCLVKGLPVLAEAEHDGRHFALKPLDRNANGKTRRDPRQTPPARTIDFDPTK